MDLQKRELNREENFDPPSESTLAVFRTQSNKNLRKFRDDGGSDEKYTNAWMVNGGGQ